MGFCGGRAIATSRGKIHHICIKEQVNHSIPEFVHEEFLLCVRQSTTGRPMVRQVQLLIDLQLNHPPIPIFWEPEDQKGSKVMYIGHWKVTNIDDISSNPILYMEEMRCAVVKLKFVRFDQRWARIINLCHDKSNEEIKTMNWDDIEDGDIHCEAGKREVSNHNLDEGAAGVNATNTWHSKQCRKTYPDTSGKDGSADPDPSESDADPLMSTARRSKRKRTASTKWERWDIFTSRSS
mmetsp:Transcript_24584/g.44143  ORF Transcript_24584/g.44143 Transcript_24584/m.44143 type:complete len:237 (+) Transcript_24584:2-712(+)